MNHEWLAAFIKTLQELITPLLFIAAITAAIGAAATCARYIIEQLTQAFDAPPDQRKKKKAEYEAYYDARLSDAPSEEAPIAYYIDSQQESEGSRWN